MILKDATRLPVIKKGVSSKSFHSLEMLYFQIIRRCQVFEFFLPIYGFVPESQSVLPVLNGILGIST